MPSRKLSLAPRNNDHPSDDHGPRTEDVLALAEEAEAEAAEAEAIAAAARARSRAIRLRRAAESAREPSPPEMSEVPETPETSETSETSEVVEEEPQTATAQRRLVRRHPWRTLAAAVAVACICALLGVSAHMVFAHRQAEQQRRDAAEFAAAARQGVVTLMSLDFTKAKEDVQRIIDNTTGDFRKDFESQAGDFAKVAEESKVITDATVGATAVESVNGDTAVVLVSANSRVTNSAGARQEPRSWRLSVSLLRENGQIKMSKVEFVP